MSAVSVIRLALLSCVFGCVRDARSAQDSTLVARRVLVAGPAGVADISPDGKNAIVDSAGRLYLRDIATNSSRLFAGSDSAWIGAARMSRDGASVFYARKVTPPNYDSLELRVHHLPTRDDRLIRRFHGRNAWIDVGDESRDGSEIYIAVRDDDWTWQLARVSVRQSAMASLKSFKWRSPSLPRLSPDGRFIAYDVSADERSNKRDIYVLATDGRGETQLTRTRENERLIGWTRDGAILATRDEGGSRDIWRISITQGRAQPERLVRRDVVAMTALRLVDDRLFYSVSNRSREIVSAPLISSTGDATRPTTLLRAFSSLAYAISPDGSQIGYFKGGENDGNGPISFFVRSLVSGDERELELPLDYIWGLSWTDRSQELLALGQKRGRDEMYRINLRDASATLVSNGLTPCGGQPGRLLPIVLTGDTTYYLRRTTGPNAELVMCPSAGAVGRVVVRGTLFPTQFAVTSDRKQLAIMERSRDTNTVHVVSIATGAVTASRPFSGADRIDGLAGWTHDGRDLLVERSVAPSGLEIWQVQPTGSSKATLAFRAAPARNPLFVPALKRVLYTVPSPPSDEVWVLEPRAIGGTIQ